MSERFVLGEPPEGFGPDPSWWLTRGRDTRVRPRAAELPPIEERIWATRDTRQVIERLHREIYGPWVVLVDGELDNEALHILHALQESAGERLVNGRVWVLGKSEHDEHVEQTPDSFPDLMWLNPKDESHRRVRENMVTDLLVLRPSAYASDDGRQDEFLGQTRYLIRDEVPRAVELPKRSGQLLTNTVSRVYLPEADSQ